VAGDVEIACAIAAETVAQNNAVLQQPCVVKEYGQFVVVVTRNLPLRLGGGTIQATARAGPRYPPPAG
jgi:hypothetical protein